MTKADDRAQRYQCQQTGTDPHGNSFPCIADAWRICICVQIKFGGKQIDQFARVDRCGDCHHARFKRFFKSDLVFAIGMLLRLVFAASDINFDLGVVDRAVVFKAVQIKRDQLPIDDADQFQIL